ncbi:MAG: hypothetical protein MRY49_00230 [Candidatus Pacebacteria bacterium]|nr:hypothetical protein [Candidatus Paceibacterota bacterium]
MFEDRLERFEPKPVGFTIEKHPRLISSDHPQDLTDSQKDEVMEGCIRRSSRRLMHLFTKVPRV